MNLEALRRLPDQNNVLRQCIDAYVTNMDAFGYRLEYMGEEGKEEDEELVLNRPFDEAFKHDQLLPAPGEAPPNPRADERLVSGREVVSGDITWPEWSIWLWSMTTPVSG